jgi:hypothetical protein
MPRRNRFEQRDRLRKRDRHPTMSDFLAHLSIRSATVRFGSENCRSSREGRVSASGRPETTGTPSGASSTFGVSADPPSFLPSPASSAGRTRIARDTLPPSCPDEALSGGAFKISNRPPTPGGVVSHTGRLRECRSAPPPLSLPVSRLRSGTADDIRAEFATHADGRAGAERRLRCRPRPKIARGSPTSDFTTI